MSDRARPMTNAEYQRAFRERQNQRLERIASTLEILRKDIEILRKEMASLRKDNSLKSIACAVVEAFKESFPLNGFPYKKGLPPAPPSKEYTLSLTHPSEKTRTQDDFDQWWSGYPDKVGKGAARKAFAKALTKTSLDQLIEGVERYKRIKPPDRDWCHPATWLNEERWLDAPPTVAASYGSGRSAEINEFRAKQLAELARKGINVLPGSML